jgi:GNAT superfamily N-acetyltransferase
VFLEFAKNAPEYLANPMVSEVYNSAAVGDEKDTAVRLAVGPNRQCRATGVGREIAAEHVEKNMVDTEIRLLTDVPAAIPVLAEWFHAEWHPYDGRSIAEIEVQLRDCLNRESLPITFLALDGTEVIGTVTLDTSDLPPYDHLSPWLASLYVVPSRRREGVGRALVEHLVAFALERGFSPIYLWTHGATRLYEECGWKVLCRDVYSGRTITLMRRALEP